MNAVQPTSFAQIPAAWTMQQPTASTVWVDPTTGAAVDSWGAPVAVAAPVADNAGWATPAATWTSPATSWSPAPVADATVGVAGIATGPQGAQGGMLEAIANTMLGIPTTATGAVAASAAASVPAPTALTQTLGAMPSPARTIARRARAATRSTAAHAARGFQQATGAAGTVARGARRVGSEVWAGIRNPRAVHVTQVPSKYNPRPAAGNADCGPVSVVMSLKLLGMSIPGIAQGAAPQRLVNRVRQLSGNVMNSAATTNHELERALTAAGARVRELMDFGSIRAAVMSGKPVILNGNPRNRGAYGHRFSPAQMTRYDGAHWVVVSGYDNRTGQFIVNDPLSKVGPVKVSPTQLEAYRAGSMGIEVAR